MATVVLATELPGAGGGLATAAAIGVAVANRADGVGARGGAVLVEVGAARRRPTLLASTEARELEDRLAGAGLSAAARGRLAWVSLDGDEWLDRLGDAIETAAEAAAVVVHMPACRLREALACDRVGASAVMIRADLPRQRALAALAVDDLRGSGVAVRVIGRAPGRVSARRAIAGIDPGGGLQRAGGRAARRLVGPAGTSGAAGAPSAAGPLAPAAAGERGQALPLALGAALLIAFAALALAAIGGGVTGKARAQRIADLAALSGARSMRDDFDRLFAPARLPDGRPNPRHIGKPAYLARAADAAVQAADRNGADPGRVRIEFPDADSFAPLRVRVELTARLEAGGAARRGRRGPKIQPVVAAVAAAAPPEGAGGEPAPARATGGGYSGPLVYRQGEGMRPDVAAAFDRMAAAAARTGVALTVNSGFRSDAEQAILFAQNPDPRMVAPPGQSLHRCATELDLGPPTAYRWLAANASRFGFVQRYSWEPWHYGFVAGPAPCSTAAERAVRPARSERSGGGDGSSAEISLPAYVPTPYREPIARAAARWNVSAALLAAQLMAESNFNPFAVSPAGAQGISQFMPATAAAYGLDDPFDAEAAIDAQAHLMADLLEQFGSTPHAVAAYNAGPAPVVACTCVPPYPETQAYVARILGLMGGAGALPTAPPPLEVRLVS